VKAAKNCTGAVTNTEAEWLSLTTWRLLTRNCRSSQLLPESNNRQLL